MDKHNIREIVFQMTEEGYDNNYIWEHFDSYNLDDESTNYLLQLINEK